MPDKNRLHIDIPLILIALLAVFLNGYSIWTDQYANTYYTTAVGSMLQNFHNFFFASLDSAGSVTVDKPPLTFWIQTISAYIFGLHGWSVILPQALAGVGSVLIMYRLIKPTFGLTAARFAALVMASTPVAAAVSRTNNIDSMLVFALLLGALLLFRSVKRNSVWSLLGAFAMIGLAFNMKMLQAYMVLPAFYLFYLLAAKITWKRKIGLLAGATAIMLVISLSWAVVVDSIPQDKRPYIGSSQSNSVLELAFGYNGIARLTGNQGHGGAAPLSGRSADAGNGDGGGQAGRDRLGDGGMPGGGMGGMFGTGQKGILRLFQAELSGQASWLLPFAAFGCIGLFAGWRRRNFTQKHKEALFWIAWLVPGMVFFSIAGFFHPYYLIKLAPPIAGLVGAGWAELWHSYRERMNWQSWLLPLAIAATSLLAWHIIRPYDTVIGGWSWAIAAGGMTAASLLPVLNNRSGKLARTAIALGLLAMFAGPLYWAATPITYGQSSMLPEAGPGTLNGQGGMFPPLAAEAEARCCMK